VRPKSEVRSVLDASVVLVYLQREPGYERVRNALTQGAAISAVNLAEVYGKVVERGLALEDIAQRLLALGLGVAAFGEDDARGAVGERFGRLIPPGVIAVRVGHRVADHVAVGIGALTLAARAAGPLERDRLHLAGVVVGVVVIGEGLHLVVGAGGRYCGRPISVSRFPVLMPAR